LEVVVGSERLHEFDELGSTHGDLEEGRERRGKERGGEILRV
jgi:hypothetical protein